MKYLFPVFVLTFLILPLIGQAQTLPSSVEKLVNFMGDIEFYLFVLGSGLGIIIIIIGGVMYMTAGADESKVGNAKKTITYGIIGFVIVAASSFIIQIVRQVIVERLVND